MINLFDPAIATRATSLNVIFTNNFFDLWHSKEIIDRGEISEYKLIEYAGLNDKNGKDVYDGDIVKVGCKHGFNSELLNEFKELKGLTTINGIGLHFTGIVRIDLLRGLMFENIENGYQEPMFTRNIYIRQNHSEIEIIGNIYQNPELLESHKKGGSGE